jgi:hypothetical protein
MYVCVCVSVCMYVCMYVYICPYVSIYLSMCMCMYMSICICICRCRTAIRPRTILLCAVHDSCELVRLQEIIHFFDKTACQLLQHFHLQQAVSIGDSTVTKCERADSGRPTCEQWILAQGLREEYFPFLNIVSISSQP